MRTHVEVPDISWDCQARECVSEVKSDIQGSNWDSMGQGTE